MRKCALFLILLLSFGFAHAEFITWSGGSVSSGTINDIDITGDFTLTVEINDGLTFNSNGILDVGVPISVIYNFTNFGLFSVDNLVGSTFFGNGESSGLFVANETDRFAFEQVPLYSSVHIGNADLGVAIEGESLSEYLGRAGNTFLSNTNGFITTEITGNNGSDISSGLITLIVSPILEPNSVFIPITITTSDTVPEPSTYVLLFLLGIFFLRYRKLNKD